MVYLHLLVSCWSWSRLGHAPTETTDRPSVTQSVGKEGRSGEDKKTRGHVCSGTLALYLAVWKRSLLFFSFFLMLTPLLFRVDGSRSIGLPVWIALKATLFTLPIALVRWACEVVGVAVLGLWQRRMESNSREKGVCLCVHIILLVGRLPLVLEF